MKIIPLSFIILGATCLPFTLSANERIAVIGAGAAGIKAASMLTEKGGYDVVIYEKRDRIGGRIETETLPNATIIEYGAIQIGPGHNYVKSEIKKLKQEMVQPQNIRTLRKDKESTRGFKVTKPGEEIASFSPLMPIIQEVHRFNKILNTFNKNQANHSHHMSTAHNYTIDFASFANQHNLAFTKLLFNSLGYGDASQLPTFLPLAFFTGFYGKTLPKTPGVHSRQLSRGFGTLLNALVEKWQLKIQLSYTITRIDRHPDEVLITGTDKNGNIHLESFSRIIIACPIDKIYPVLSTPTKAETSLDENILYHPYHTVAANLRTLPKGNYILSDKLQLPGHLQFIKKNTSHDNLALLYVPQDGPYHGRNIRDHHQKLPGINVTIDNIKRDLEEYGLTLSSVKDTRTWNEHYPHFNSPDDYLIIHLMQGEHRTYYVGTMTQPADFVDSAFKSAIEVVDQHFTEKQLSKQK